jgi:hypothetical protein
VDIIIEGKITPEEGMNEVIQTVIDLKNLQNPILRISSSDSDLQGRVSFSSGHILGGRINNTDETGYPAIRKLLSITDGNYAILDPGRQHITDVNQTLWIEANKILQMLPNLPQTPEVLMDMNSDHYTAELKPRIAAMDLRAGKADGGEKPTVTDLKSKARSFDEGAWFFFKLFIWALGTLIATAVIIQYGDQIYAIFKAKQTNPAVQVSPKDQAAPQNSASPTAPSTAPTSGSGVTAPNQTAPHRAPSRH